MRILRRRRLTPPAARLLGAAGVDPKSVSEATDVAICQRVALQVARRDAGDAEATLSVAEELLADQANYEFVMTFLEQLQNLVSHRLEMFVSPAEVATLLGPRCTVCWTTLAEFWAAVASWCAQALPPLESSETILSVQNEELQALLWTGNRTLPTGAKLGLAQAVMYEKAMGVRIPGFSHIAVALRSTGRD